MGKASGGIRNKSGSTRDIKVFGGGGSGAGVKIGKLESISNIKDDVSGKEVKRAISKFESRLGLNTNQVKIANIDGAFGVARIDPDGKKTVVILNKKAFNDSKYLKAAKTAEYASGSKVRTNAPLQHTVIHELAHAKWSTHHNGQKYKDAGKEIIKIYRQYKAQKATSLGAYARSSVNEFFAEGISKGLVGKGNQYSTKLINIVRKYKL